MSNNPIQNPFTMKAKIFPVMILISVLLISACKKDTQKESPVQSPSISAEDMRLYHKIHDFKEKGQTNLKDGEEIPIEEAIWYLEATANCTYGDASEETIETSTAVTYVSLDVNNQMVDLNELWTRYELMIDDIRAYYLAINSTEKQLMSVNVEPQDITSTQITCKVTSTFATGGFYQFPCSFNPTDGWEAIGGWVNSGGICSGPNIGMYMDRDAASEIQRKIMNCKAYPVGNYWYEETETITIWAYDYSNPGWSSGSPNYFKYRMYWNSTLYNDCHTCLSPQNPDELNFYLEGTKWVINTLLDDGGARPPNKSMISVQLVGDYVLYPYPSYHTEYFHWGTIQYGILHISPKPPEPLD
jgi:hypothetical protein